jgi:predicted Zn-dependent protease
MFGEPNEQEKQKLARIEVLPQEERKIGDAAADSYIEQLKQRGIRVVSRGPIVEYLRDLVNTIRPLMRNRQRYPRIKVLYANSPECEARSFPGGMLVFHRGLLDSCTNEAALIGIVGHELSHLDRGHHLWRIRRIKLARQMFSGQRQTFSLAEFFDSGTTVMHMWTRPFAPELEAEADHDGATWAYQAGYDPREMARLFASLNERRPGIPLPGFLKSHPAPLDRSRAVMSLYAELQQTNAKEDLYIGTENLRRRVARVRREFPE